MEFQELVSLSEELTRKDDPDRTADATAISMAVGANADAITAAFRDGDAKAFLQAVRDAVRMDWEDRWRAALRSAPHGGTAGEAWARRYNADIRGRYEADKIVNKLSDAEMSGLWGLKAIFE